MPQASPLAHTNKKTRIKNERILFACAGAKKKLQLPCNLGVRETEHCQETSVNDMLTSRVPVSRQLVIRCLR